MKNRWLTLVPALCVLSLTVAACGSDSGDDTAPRSDIDPNLGGGAAWEATVESAEEEGKVVLYTSADGAEKTLPAAFNETYPDIELVVVHYASGDLTAKVDAEGGTTESGADVAMASSKGWWDTTAARMPVIEGPALEEYWSDQTDNVLEDGKFVMTGATPLGAAVNTDRLEELGVEPIESYTDLLQPALKGNLGVVPGEGSPAAEQWWNYAAEEMGGQDGLDQLATLEPRVYESGTTPLATDVASGEIAVGFYATRSSVAALVEQGAPVEFVPLEPAVAIAGYAGIVGSSRPDAAQVFMNWLLSPAGQVSLLGEGNAWTALPLDKLGEVPDTMEAIPEGSYLTDGLLTPEQSKFYETSVLPALGR